MIIAIDTETQGLDATRFIMGCICRENLKTEVFNQKQRMWERILELADSQRKQGKCLIVYAHNMAYDYYAIRPLPEPKNVRQYSQNPFIVDIEDENGKIYCKFTSTTSLWRGSLATLGEALGYEKTPTPEWLKQTEHTPNFMELHEATEYMKQDTRVVMHFLQTLRNLLKEHQMRPRWILTASQIGILGLLKKATKSEALFADPLLKRIHQCKYKEDHHEAVRGGRIQCFHTGEHKDLTVVDFRSHYPYHLATMRFPHLNSALKHHEPKKDILNEIGVSNVEIETKKHSYGVLPVRYKGRNIYPKKGGQLLIGTWTNQEIRAAMQRGYKLKRIKWSITYTEAENPFVQAVNDVYELKKTATTPMHRWLYKIFLNGGIGKFAQHRPKYTTVWKDEKYTDLMLRNGYHCIQSQGMWNLWERYEGIDYPRFYAPILNAIVTADARIRLLEHMEKIPPQDLIYIDTDSMIARTKAIDAAKFKYSENLGGLSIEEQGVDGLFWGPKAYAVGQQVKLSGVSKIFVDRQKFDAGTVTYKQMITAKNTWDATKVGTFREITRNLTETADDQLQAEQEASKEKVLIDERITAWVTGGTHYKQ